MRGFAPGAATGSIATAELEVELGPQLRPIGAEPFRHLPYDFLYRARLPRTKLLSPDPDARFTGSVTVDGERLELDGWPGMVGHNWGAEHAERWSWIQANDFDGAPDGGSMPASAGSRSAR